MRKPPVDPDLYIPPGADRTAAELGAELEAPRRQGYTGRGSRADHTEITPGSRPGGRRRSKEFHRIPDNSSADRAGVCRVCGCTDDNACPGGCAWVDAGRSLCSSCLVNAAGDLLGATTEAVLVRYFGPTAGRALAAVAETLAVPSIDKIRRAAQKGVKAAMSSRRPAGAPRRGPKRGKGPT
jgi:hypothetical protein